MVRDHRAGVTVGDPNLSVLGVFHFAPKERTESYRSREGPSAKFDLLSTLSIYTLAFKEEMISQNSPTKLELSGCLEYPFTKLAAAESLSIKQITERFSRSAAQVRAAKGAASNSSCPI